MVEMNLAGRRLTVTQIKEPPYQYNNIADTVRVTGDIPDGGSWALLIAIGGYLDIIPLDAGVDALTCTLTAAQLSMQGYYTLQLRHSEGDTVWHSTPVLLQIGKSLSGDEQWPEIPTAFTEALERAEAAIDTAREIEGTVERAKSDAEAARDTAEGYAVSASGSAAAAVSFASAAHAAQTAAKTAQSAAQTAQAAAETARDTASGSAATAAQAATAAAGSATEAQTAQGLAEDAQDAAEAAQTAAEAAQTAAEAAQAAAEAATSTKADKVSGAEAGNLAALDKDGNLVDSEIAASEITSKVDFAEDQQLTDAQKAQARANINAAAPDGFYGNSGGVYQYSTNFLGKNAPQNARDIVFRPTASQFSGQDWSADSIGGDTATIERIKGKTLGWNQVIASTPWNTINASRNVEDGIITVTASTKGGRITKTLNSLEVGDIIIYSAYVKSTSDKVCLGLGTNGYAYHSGNGNFELLIFRKEITSSVQDTLTVIDERNENFDSFQVRDVNCINLTKMFGAGNEIATVKEFRAMFPLDYDYNPGELISFNGTGLQTTGFNQLKPDGTINVIGGMTYRIEGAYTSLVDSAGNAVTVTDNEFTPSQDDTYTMVGGSCVHLKWSGVRDGDTEDYWQRTLALPIAQYFPDGMKSAGTVYDELTKDKAIKMVGKLDLGTIAWTRTSVKGNYVFRANSHFVTKNAGGLCANYRVVGSPVNALKNGEMSGGSKYWDSNRRIVVRDDTYTTTADFKAAMSGVMFYYELAEPVITPISPELNLTYKVDDFGTEKLLPENTATPVTAPMDADIVYQLDYEADVRNMDVNMISKESMDNFISAFNASGLGTITQTLDATNKKYSYTVTAPQPEPTGGGETV